MIQVIQLAYICIPYYITIVIQTYQSIHLLLYI